MSVFTSPFMWQLSLFVNVLHYTSGPLLALRRVHGMVPSDCTTPQAGPVQEEIREASKEARLLVKDPRWGTYGEQERGRERTAALSAPISQSLHGAATAFWSRMLLTTQTAAERNAPCRALPIFYRKRSLFTLVRYTYELNARFDSFKFIFKRFFLKKAVLYFFSIDPSLAFGEEGSFFFSWLCLERRSAHRPLHTPRARSRPPSFKMKDELCMGEAHTHTQAWKEGRVCPNTATSHQPQPRSKSSLRPTTTPPSGTSKERGPVFCAMAE